MTCCSLVYSVSIHKSVTVYTKDQKAVRQSHMASKLDLIAFFCCNVVWENGLGKHFSMPGEASVAVGRWRANATYLPSQSKHNGVQKRRRKNLSLAHTFQTMNERTDE